MRWPIGRMSHQDLTVNVPVEECSFDIYVPDMAPNVKCNDESKARECKFNHNCIHRAEIRTRHLRISPGNHPGLDCTGTSFLSRFILRTTCLGSTFLVRDFLVHFSLFPAAVQGSLHLRFCSSAFISSSYSSCTSGGVAGIASDTAGLSDVVV